MLEEISSEIFAEWMAYFAVEPFGHLMQDMHFATLESILVNANRSKGKQAVKPKDFLLIKPSVRQTAQQFWEGLKSWAIRSGVKKRD